MFVKVSKRLILRAFHMHGINNAMICIVALIDQKQCAGSEDAVQARLESLASQWETLVGKSTEKSDKLKEASRQQTYNAGVKDMEFWLGEVSY